MPIHNAATGIQDIVSTLPGATSSSRNSPAVMARAAAYSFGNPFSGTHFGAPPFSIGVRAQF